jgi:hypothetical protein
MATLFRDPARRDVDAATWSGPFGPLLVCLSDSFGYDLYSPEEWESISNSTNRPEYTADDEGRVIFHERLTGCIVPLAVRAKAIH